MIDVARDYRIIASVLRRLAAECESEAIRFRRRAGYIDEHAAKIEKANQPEGANRMGQYTPAELDEIFTDTNVPGLAAENISDDQRQAASALLAGAREYADTVVANTPDDVGQSREAIDSLRQVVVHSIGALGLPEAPPDGGVVAEPGEGPEI